MVIPRKHLHTLKTSRKFIRKKGTWFYKRMWVVRCTSCSLRHLFKDEATAQTATNFIESSMLTKNQVILLDSGS